MNKLRYLTAGESHGQALSAILEGIPSGLCLTRKDIDTDLRRRQQGVGRGGRMKIEQDRVEIISGVRLGRTLGSPINLLIKNRDWENWKDVMSPDPGTPADSGKITRPRPGHADLAGYIKYAHDDIRDVLERSSARETAARVGIGAVCRKFLSLFAIIIQSHVLSIGGEKSRYIEYGTLQNPLDTLKSVDEDPVRCADSEASARMIERIHQAEKEGYSLGGVFEVVVSGLPVGLGSYVHWDRKLNARLAYALNSIQAVKGVEIGRGFSYADYPGSEVHDEILLEEGKLIRPTNNAGGIEGGMSNGQPIVVRAVMKPIPTQSKPLRSVDLHTMKPIEAAYERSDTCAVPAAAVVGEAVVAFEIASAFMEKFGGDSMKEIRENFNRNQEFLAKKGSAPIIYR
jgi:chorismate synthase